MNTKQKKINPQKALEFFQQGKHDKAEALLRDLLQQVPGYAYGWFLLGIIHAQKNDLIAAESAMQNAIKAQPNYPDAHNNLGVLYEKMQQLDKAKQAYKTALAQKPDYAQALYNLANIYKSQGEAEQAIDYYYKALKIDPDYVNALINLGVTYQYMNNNKKAIAMFNRALLIAPNDVTLLNDMGLSYYYEFEFNKALDYFQKALMLAPGLASGFINIAQVLQSNGEFMAARQYFEKALTDPTHRTTALNNISLLELGQLNFSEGWDYYQNRESINAIRHHIPTTLPKNLKGVKFLICKDQGLGDEIFFLRFVSYLIKQGALITYYTDPRMVNLLSESIKGVRVTDTKVSEALFDFVLPVSELPRLLHSRIENPTPEPLALSINEKRLTEIQNALPNNNKRNIAITWQAGTLGTNRLFKRIEPELLGTLLRDIDANILILQRNPGKVDLKKLEQALGRKAFNFSYINSDLEDTVAFLSVIDDYIAVSNTNVHLLAGLGKTARIFVPHPPEWRWTFQMAHSPWFPGYSLYRQDLSGQWQEAIAHCRNDLYKDLSH